MVARFRGFLLAAAIALATPPLRAQIVLLEDEILPEKSGWFGGAVGVSGESILVGNMASSTAHFFDHRGETWVEIHRDVGMSWLGLSVAIEGDLAVVGAPAFNEYANVYERVAGVWGPPIRIYTQFGRWYGTSVATDGTTVAVGMPKGLPGQVLIYQKVAGQWTRTHTVARPGTEMGHSLDLGGNRFVAGDGGAKRDGRAWVWRFFPGGQTLEAVLRPSRATGGDFFGGSVAIDPTGTRIAIGASGHEPDGLWRAGAVYVFTRTGNTWNQGQRVLAEDRSLGDTLGTSVALSGDRLLVGATLWNRDPGEGHGAAYLFELVNGTWTQKARIRPGAGVPPQTYFAADVDLDGNRAVVNAITNTGDARVFVFDLSGPLPTVYCRAKQNSQGCLPAIGFEGEPTFGGPEPFRITAAQLLNQKVGILFYGSARTDQYFQGGRRCVVANHRIPLASSGGNPPPDDCSGGYSVDFGARIRGGLDPSLVPGAKVHAQFWTRDGADRFGSGLTDALQFTIGI